MGLWTTSVGLSEMRLTETVSCSLLLALPCCPEKCQLTDDSDPCVVDNGQFIPLLKVCQNLYFSPDFQGYCVINQQTDRMEGMAASPE